MSATLVFIGGGNMARALIAGLIAGGEQPANIAVAEPDADKRTALAREHGVSVAADGAALVGTAATLVLAVKPQVLRAVASTLASALPRPAPLVISIAAGVRSADIARWFGGAVAVVRCMPNTPALVRRGITALYAAPEVGEGERMRAAAVLGAVGTTVWVEHEADLDAVTALSGSGPAYFFLVMEALEQAGVALGLQPEVARVLAVRTALGAGALAAESGTDPAALRVQVTSPGGTTERALEVLRGGGLEALFLRAVQAACVRAAELADDAGRSA